MKKSEKPIGKIKVKKSIFKRLFFHILVLFILAVIVSGTLNCIENIQRTRRFTRQLTESASKVATETFERCDINALLDNPDSEEYRKAVKTLRWICQTNHLEYMYIYIPNFDENKVTYVMTVADDDSENENVLRVRSAGAEVDRSLWDAEKEAWENPILVTAYKYQNDSFGSFYTAFSAIQGKDGKPVALIGADYSLTQIYTEIIFYTAMRVLALFVVLAIVFLLVMRFVRKKMYNPILLIFEKIRGYFSCFLSEPVDVTKYGVIYGGVQKNVGPAGVVIAIIREDLITDDVLEGTPTMLKWKTQADADSLYNTPPCYGIYICGKVFKWIKKMGGLEAMKAHNEKKAKILYDYLDQSKLFKGTVVPEDRSLMNVPFVTGDAELDKKFVAEATAAGFVNLKGHRTVGGMRASIYNAMPIEGVEKLVEFIKKFEAENA